MSKENESIEAEDSENLKSPESKSSIADLSPLDAIAAAGREALAEYRNSVVELMDLYDVNEITEEDLSDLEELAAELGKIDERTASLDEAEKAEEARLVRAQEILAQAKHKEDSFSATEEFNSEQPKENAEEAAEEAPEVVEIVAEDEGEETPEVVEETPEVVEVVAEDEGEETPEVVEAPEVIEDEETPEVVEEALEAEEIIEATVVSEESEEVVVDEEAPEADASVEINSENDPADEESALVEESDQEDIVSNQADATSPAELIEKAPASAAPRTITEHSPKGEITYHAAANLPTHQTGEQFESMTDIATAMHNRWRSFGKVPNGDVEHIYIAGGRLSDDMPDEWVLGKDESHNWNVLDGVRKAVQSDALVAGGGICAPSESRYDIFRVAEPCTTLYDYFPTVQASRGAIRFMCPADYTQAFGGAGITTTEDDAAGYVTTPVDCGGPGPTPEKPCVCIECQPIKECQVDAFHHCVEVGNLQSMTYPEQVEGFLADLAVVYSQLREQFLLDAVEAEATVVDGGIAGGAGYGASRSILWDITVAATNFRKRFRMSRDAQLTWFIPDWTLDLIRVDMVNNHHEGLNFWDITDEMISAAFRRLNLTVVTYCEGSSASPEQTFADPQVPGPLNQFPDNVRTYLFMPGSFVRLTTGELNLGLIRDYNLVRRNSFASFYEEWMGLCYVGLPNAVLAIDHAVCPGGHGGAAVSPICQNIV